MRWATAIAWAALAHAGHLRLGEYVGTRLGALLPQPMPQHIPADGGCVELAALNLNAVVLPRYFHFCPV